MCINAAQASHLTTISISGKYNDMADIVSRAFQKGEFFAANKNLTAYFKTHFPLPQEHSWDKLTLLPKWTQQVMSCMIFKQFTLGSILRLPRIRENTGRYGNTMPSHGTLTLSSKTVTSFASSLLSQLFLHGSRKGTMSTSFKSRIQPFLRRYLPSLRPSTWLENPVPSK